MTSAASGDRSRSRRPSVRDRMAATSGSSTPSTARPSGANASTSSPLAAATTSRDPNSPRCAVPTLRTTAMAAARSGTGRRCGRPPVRCTRGPGAGSTPRPEHRERQTDLVVQRASAATVEPPRHQHGRDQVLGRGLPGRPVTPTTRQLVVRRSTPPARKPSDRTVSSTMIAGPSTGRLAQSDRLHPGGNASPTCSGRRCARPRGRRTANRPCTAASRRRPVQPPWSARQGRRAGHRSSAATSPRAHRRSRDTSAIRQRGLPARRPDRRRRVTCPPISWPCS